MVLINVCFFAFLLSPLHVSNPAPDFSKLYSSLGCTCVYEGSKTSCTVKNLIPFTSYVFRIRAINNTDEGPYSGPALITTNEGGRT